MSLTSNVLCGPLDTINIPKGSVGQLFLNSLRKRRPDEVINLDAATKKALTCGRAVEESIKCTFILKNLGVKKGEMIAIISENTINYCLPVLGALYAGVTVNPLNPTYTAGELKHGLLISKAKVIFCSERVLQTVTGIREELTFVEAIVVMDLESGNNSCLCLKELLEDTKLDNGYKPEELDPDHDAFVCLSSGTTGLAKGVVLTHGNLRPPLSIFIDPLYVNTKSDDTTILVLPFFHIYGLLIQLTAFISGMKLVLMEKFVPDLFMKSIQDHKATKLFLVPPILLFLVKASGTNQYDISTVNDIICAAAPLSKEIQDEAKRRLSMVTIRQVYGLTEVTGPSTCHRTDVKKTGHVGSLVPLTSARVWDPVAKTVLGPLEVGELCFKGPIVMKGYYGNESATKDCIDEGGFYHSGDLGYYDEEGLFYVVDRIKEVIKYKGFQVPPAELEALIVTHPAVKECGVIGIPDERVGEVPLAYVVPQDGSGVTEEQIVNFVAERISVNKRLYGGVKFLEEIPKSPSGKILRRILREIYKST